MHMHNENNYKNEILNFAKLRTTVIENPQFYFHRLDNITSKSSKIFKLWEIHAANVSRMDTIQYCIESFNVRKVKTITPPKCSSYRKYILPSSKTKHSPRRID